MSDFGRELDVQEEMREQAKQETFPLDAVEAAYRNGITAAQRGTQRIARNDAEFKRALTNYLDSVRWCQGNMTYIMQGFCAGWIALRELLNDEEGSDGNAG
jgi:bifunctional pyridoxal-dependent enzyme with beta-cystathionase and maltose regulon repressor activities